ncbi:hypothetical protein JTF60_gp28 [Microbacterium phage Efeko]|uniref:Uncharacterized protein n=1 Tax=Microbacterium phage Efeko TaxID=2315704 RepID=A0A386KMI4_9CAUD|nr:hypothetical protein JTF60_gp28 [Microbacterium phage Efeko]AYD86274.1 hypothetical protein SEA_EFEKO_28 [Microbacterium phage Efeko]
MSTTTPDTNPEQYDALRTELALDAVLIDATRTLDALHRGDELAAEHHANLVRDTIDQLTPLDRASVTINLAYAVITLGRLVESQRRPRRRGRRRFSV